MLTSSRCALNKKIICQNRYDNSMNSKDRRSTIFKLALPTSLGMISTMAMDLVDMMMVGSLGTSAIAAIGVAGLIHIVVLSFVTNISLVIQALSPID